MKLEPYFLSRNGTNRVKFVVRDDNDQPIHSDTVTLESSLSRRRLAQRLADITKCDIDEIDRKLLAVMDGPHEADAAKTATSPNFYDLLEAMPQDARDEAAALLSNPNVLTQISRDIAALGVAGEKSLRVTIYLVGTSRMLRKPNSAIIQGPSASGKSHTIERVADLFPPEAIIRAQQLSPQALFHLTYGALRHRFIVAGERSRMEDDDAAEATRALREMISSGELSKLIAGKDEHNRIVTRQITQPGPIAFIESTTLGRIFDEDLNRCLLLSTDERPEQTKRIVLAQAARHAGPRPEVSQIILPHHALQRMLALEPVEATIPFAQHLGELFPTDRTEARRAFGQAGARNRNGGRWPTTPR